MRHLRKRAAKGQKATPPSNSDFNVFAVLFSVGILLTILEPLPVLVPFQYNRKI
jgi:hypothetical protein